MPLTLYNTLEKKKAVFRPLKKGVVKFYSCGPTVYNYAHIGNFRAFVCSDILKRYLLYKGYKVIHVMNITDVDDKTIRDSKKEGKSLKEFTEFYTKAFFEDLKALNILPADYFPKATQTIGDMVKLIKSLLEKGFAYKAKDGIYFKVSEFREYGKLSGIKPDELKSGARICSDEYNKENARDFALWKFWDENDGDVFWETELGKGRPGWHIECSAMSMKYLGKSFDIHSGGIDLIFPHHENEIAQSEAATGKPFANYWFHNEYILVEGKKMSKSLGNFYTLRDLLKKGYNRKAIRYLLLSSNYRQQLNFSFSALKAAESAVKRLQEFYNMLYSIIKKSRKQYKGKEDNSTNSNNNSSKAQNKKGTADSLVEAKTGELTKSLTESMLAAFEDAMDDDLNISSALAAVFEYIKDINKIAHEREIKKEEAIEAIEAIEKIDSVIAVLEKGSTRVPENIIALAREREEARKRKEYSKADALREKIRELGYEVADTKNGPELKKITI